MDLDRLNRHCGFEEIIKERRAAGRRKIPRDEPQREREEENQDGRICAMRAETWQDEANFEAADS